jgi:hypothetical protein
VTADSGNETTPVSVVQVTVVPSAVQAKEYMRPVVGSSAAVIKLVSAPPVSLYSLRYATNTFFANRHGTPTLVNIAHPGGGGAPLGSVAVPGCVVVCGKVLPVSVGVAPTLVTVASPLGWESLAVRAITATAEPATNTAMTADASAGLVRNDLNGESAAPVGGSDGTVVPMTLPFFFPHIGYPHHQTTP